MLSRFRGLGYDGVCALECDPEPNFELICGLCSMLLGDLILIELKISSPSLRSASQSSSVCDIKSLKLTGLTPEPELVGVCVPEGGVFGRDMDLIH